MFLWTQYPFSSSSLVFRESWFSMICFLTFLECTVAQNNHHSELICYPSIFNLPRLLFFIKSFRIIWSFYVFQGVKRNVLHLLTCRENKQSAKEEIKTASWIPKMVSHITLLNPQAANIYMRCLLRHDNPELKLLRLSPGSTVVTRS